ncbi:MAG: tryptophanyl-tRNA synthetase [Chloroflexi bacterium]|nr:tryptophanyl-tRNA synthetase [Chloroflexota bacterium]
MATKGRLLTGDRPTGPLHLGHFVGTLENRVRLQDEYECYFIIADLHVLTTAYEDPAAVEGNIRELVLDYLSVGIDPDKSTVYVQSLVPQVAEIALLFGMLVSVPRLQRIPTLKDVMRDLKLETASLGLLSYPVLQSADILMVRGEVVPVGKDQVSHVELTREIARRFNGLYGEVFPEAQALVGRVPTLPGTDGKRKMSKSLGNAIFLSDDEKTVERRVMSMFTDPTRLRATDPGHVRGNPVFAYHDAFNPDQTEVTSLKRRYRAGKVGDVEVKRKLAQALNTFLTPIREHRAEFAAQPDLVESIIRDGSSRARAEAEETLRSMKHAMKLDYFREGTASKAKPDSLPTFEELDGNRPTRKFRIRE